MTAIILDTETSGFNEPRLVELAYVPVHFPDGRRWLAAGDVEHHRFNPGKPIEIEALATHHILDRDVVDSPPESSWVFPAATQYVIGHNIDFDCVPARVPATVKRICTLAVARSLYAEGKHTQSALMYRLFDHVDARESVRRAHGAVADVFMCLRILNAMLSDDRMAAVKDFASLYAFSEAARLPKIMGFGKHKGMPVEKVPMDYRWWYAKQEDPDPWLLKAWKMAPSRR